MNGFAALDIHPHRRYVVDIGGRRSCRCRLHINFALFLHSLDFTQNLGVTPIILMNGQDLMQVLENRISLTDLILLKRRHAAETGEIMYHVNV